jgi:hypothetical protein
MDDANRQKGRDDMHMYMLYAIKKLELEDADLADEEAIDTAVRDRAHRGCTRSGSGHALPCGVEGLPAGGEHVGAALRFRQSSWKREAAR